MTIKRIFQISQIRGYLTDQMKAEIEKVCAPEASLSNEDDFYLELLMGAIFSGEIRQYC